MLSFIKRDTKLVAISSEIAKLRLDKVDFLFTSSGMGVYENDALGRMVLRNSGKRHICSQHPVVCKLKNQQT